MKWNKVKFRLHIRKIFLTAKSISLWNSLPGEAVKAPQPESFKARLENIRE